ncbi:helix-turn-helix transcriptional regulator [Virgibacillus sp. C22-A2]|uniref:Helix-turn-helix transcriptional regulator n=1 Tax=Virgibacillus tibetensis TaxID=3042313 RepID=A0ABU6KC28_9BACI|nr:helix-turn-helix transcriptional regulator [Virgibacillus sp. C22-A2]
MTRKKTKLSQYVGNKIREYRKKQKLTQKELGDKIGVKHNTISSYESGTVSPEQDSLFALSRALEVKVDDFFPARDDSLGNLDRAIELSNEDLNLDELGFLNDLLLQVNTLEGEERKRFWDNIKFAVEFYKSHK